MIDKLVKGFSSPGPAEAIQPAPMTERLKDSRQRLENKITERTRDLSALYAAMAPLISSDAGQLVQQIVERLKEATGADAALIRILDKDTNYFLHPAHVGFSAGFLEATRRLDKGSAVGAAFISGQPIIAADIAEDARLKGKRQLEEGFVSCAFLPFKVSGELRGIIHLASREAGHFSEEKRDHLIAIARQMGVAMENRELFEESNKRAQEQAALSAVAVAASQSLEVHEMLQNALAKVLEVTGRERGSIRLKDTVTGKVSLFAHRGFSADEVEELLRRTSHKMSEEVFASGKPLVINDGMSTSEPQTLLPQSRSVAWIPIKARQQVIGVLGVSAGRPIPFAEREVDFLQAIGHVVGVALENARLYEKERNQVESLRLLVDASQKLVERVDIDTLAQDILNTVVTSFGVRLAWIGSAEPDGLVRPLYWAGDVADYLRHVEIRWDDSPLGQGPAGRAIRSGRPVVMDVATDPGFEPWREPALAHGYREVAAFPLIRGAKPFGHLILYSGETGYFTHERVELLQTYANIATAALEGARLFDETKRQAQEKAALNTIATALSQSLDVEEILNIAIDKVIEATGRERGYIRLKDPVTGEISLAVHRGISEQYVENLRQRRTPGENIDHVFATGEPLILNDPDKIPVREELIGEGRRVMASIPLKTRGRVVGILNLSSTRLLPFSSREVEMLQAIGHIIGVALENGWLYFEAQQQQEIQKLLKELSQDITILGLEPLLTKIAGKVREIFRVDLADFRLLEEGVAKFIGRVGEWGDLPISMGNLRGRMGWILKNRKPLVISDTTMETELPTGESVRRLGIRGYLAVPLYSRSGEIIGVVRVLTYQPRDFRQDQVDLLQQLANGAAIAIENARLFEETEQRAHEQAALSAIATATSQSLDVDEMLQLALDKVLEVTGREKGYVRLRDPLTSQLKLTAHRGISDTYVALLQRRTPGGKSDQVFKTGEPLIINAPEKALLREETRQEANNSIAWIPLKAHGKVVGILNVSTAQPVCFTAREVELLQAIGNVIGVAVENAWLYMESRQQQEVQKLLKELSQDITSLDIDALFQKVTDNVREFFKVDISDIRLLDETGRRRTVGSSGIESERLYKLGTSRGRSGWMRENRRVLVIPDLTKDSSGIPAGDTTNELGVRGYLAVPLFSRSGEVIGILRALTYEPREFTQSEVDLLQQLANGTAIALTNARLFEETEQRAQEQAALNAIATATSQSLHLDELLQIALDKVLEVTGREQGYIRLKDTLTGNLTLAVHRGISEKYVETLLHERTPEGKSDQVLESGETLVINDPEGALLKEQTRSEGRRSMSWFPLKVRGRAVGIMNVSTTRHLPFQLREVELLKAIGNVIGVALENARLFEETEHRAAELAALYAVTAAVSASFDLEQILLQGLDAVLGVTAMDGGYIQLLEGEPPQLALKAHSGMSESFIAKLRSELRPGGKTEQIIATKQPVVLEDIPPEHVGKFSGEKITAAVWVPIMSKEKVIGVFTISSKTKRTFPQDQLPLLVSIGNALGVALENARLFDDTNRLVDKLQTATRNLDAKNKELNTFVYTVSHDLKAPLVSLQGMTELLLQDYGDKLDGDGHHYLERLKFNAGHMERLLIDLLALSRIGREGRSSEKVHLDEVVDGVLLEHSEKIQSRKIRVNRLPLPALWGIRVQIEQVMSNLLGNAIKYLGETSSPTIEIGAEDQGETVQCYVKDNGIGIAPAYHEKVFEIFQRLQETEVEGTGVGLSIVKKIVEGAGGRAWVQSAKGRGVTFYFTWPKTPKTHQDRNNEKNSNEEVIQ